MPKFLEVTLLLYPGLERLLLEHYISFFAVILQPECQETRKDLNESQGL